MFLRRLKISSGDPIKMVSPQRLIFSKERLLTMVTVRYVRRLICEEAVETESQALFNCQSSIQIWNSSSLKNYSSIYSVSVSKIRQHILNKSNIFTLNRPVSLCGTFGETRTLEFSTTNHVIRKNYQLVCVSPVGIS